MAKPHKGVIHPARRFSGSLAAISGGILAVIGIYAVAFSHAAQQQLYFSPSSGTLTYGQTIALKVYVNPAQYGQLGAVQANVSYNTNQLQYVSYSNAGSVMPVDQGTKVNQPGTLKFSRSTTSNANMVRSAGVVVTVTFKAVSSSGTALVTFGSGSAIYTSTTISGNGVPLTAGSASIALSAAPTPTPTPIKTTPPIKTPTPQPGTPTPKSTTPTPTPTDGSSTPTPTPTASDSPIVTSSGDGSGTGNDSAVLDQGALKFPLESTSSPVSISGVVTLEANDNWKQTKLSFQVDGHTLGSGRLDTTYYNNGSHTLKAIYTAADGTEHSVTLPVSINNKLGTWQKARNTIVAAFGGRPGVALGTIVTLVLLMLGALGYLLVWPAVQANMLHKRLMADLASASPDAAPLATPASMPTDEPVDLASIGQVAPGEAEAVAEPVVEIAPESIPASEAPVETPDAPPPTPESNGPARPNARDLHRRG